MPGHTEYPTVDDLVSRLQGAGIDAAKITALQTGGALEGAIEATIAQWESAVGWRPFLAGNADTTRQFDPPTRVSAGGRVPGTRTLTLKGGLLTIASVTVSGTPMEIGLDVFARPDNAPALGKPYTYLDFLSPLYGVPQTIEITGRWGKVAEVPADVWNALIQFALAEIAPDLGLAISGGLLERKIGDSTKRYAGTGSNGPMDQQRQAWPQAFQRAVKHHKRITL